MSWSSTQCSTRCILNSFLPLHIIAFLLCPGLDMSTIIIFVIFIQMAQGSVTFGHGCVCVCLYCLVGRGCVWFCVWVCVCVCVCVCVTETQGEKKTVCVCACVCV